MAAIAALASVGFDLAGFSYSHDRQVSDDAMEAKSLEPAALWVDARVASQFVEGHVPGALSLNDANWESSLAQLFSVWEPGRRVVVYCAVGCSAADMVAARLREVGIEPVHIFEGGFEEWKRSNR